jgi:hypothetical protein
MSNTIGWYNGWNGADRLEVLVWLKAAVAAGTIAAPARCSVCLTHGSTDGRTSDAIVFHDEDYSRPHEAYPICRPCHRLLHLRFWRQAEWASHITVHMRGGAWFERLDMDPDSRFRPFHETYPMGLPLAFAP